MLELLLTHPQLCGKRWLIESWYKSAVASFKPEKAATETGGCSAPYTVVSNRFRLQLQTHCQTVAVMVFILCDLCGESLQGVFL